MTRPEKIMTSSQENMVCIVAVGVPVAFVISIILATFLCQFVSEKTVYGPGFSERKFASIRIGMTPPEVEAILGPPLQRRAWGGFDDVSFYSYSQDDTGNFWRKWVVWKDGKAELKLNDFWYD